MIRYEGVVESWCSRYCNGRGQNDALGIVVRLAVMKTRYWTDMAALCFFMRHRSRSVVAMIASLCSDVQLECRESPRCSKFATH